MIRHSELLFLEGNEIVGDFFEKKENLLLILGKGFDPRACKVLKLLKSRNVCLTTWLIDYNEKLGYSDSQKNESRSNKNQEQFEILCENSVKEVINAPSYKVESGKRRLVISESVRIFLTKKKIELFDNIIVDLSAMPRAVGFSIIKRILDIKNGSQKVYLIVCENSECDNKIKPKIVDESAEYLQGFNTFSMLSEADDDETIWFPALGMNEKGAFDIIYDYIRPMEICPIVPFPAMDVRRSENILRQFGTVLFKEREIEKRNIIYVPEYVPAIVAEKLYNTVKYYEKALNNEGTRDIRYAFSSQSSKLIDMGILLAVIELAKEGIKTGIVIVENQGYESPDEYDESKEKIYCLCLNECEFDW